MLRFVQNNRVLVCSHRLENMPSGWDASYEVRVFLSQSSRRLGEMIVFLSALRNIRDVLASAQVFQFMYVEKNLFYYKEILHFATLRSEWQSSSL